jgi:hypothetical protein
MGEGARACAAAAAIWLSGCGGCGPRADLRGLPIEADLSAGRATGAGSFDHAAWGRVLAVAAHPADGTVDYDAVPRADLDRYVAAVAQAPLDQLPAAEQQALLINAYNALTVSLILDQPARPASIRDLPDPWGTAQWTVGGHAVSLDDLEHGLLRPLFQDPRLHFALNCASVSCPPLRAEPFVAASLDAQLDQAARDTLARDRWLRVDGDTLHVTKLLDWYGDDFTRDGWAPTAPTRAAWLATHGPPAVARAVEAADGAPELRFLDYDWALNAAR